MIAKIIEFSSRNRFIIFLFLIFLIMWGYWALKRTPLDAIPDLSDTQVIIFTEWSGRSPDLVEDQITYPISSTLLSAPKVQVVRGFSFPGNSFIYVIFEEGINIYWARSRILEYLQGVKNKLPSDVNPVLGPDATSLGWGFSYALIDETGQHNLAGLRSIQDWNIKLALESVPGVSQVASIGGFVRQYQITLDPTRLSALNISITKVMDAVRRSNKDVEGRVIEFSGIEYMIRGRGYVRTLKDLENIPVGTNGAGTPIFLKDVGRVQLGPEIRRGLADLDGKGEVAGGIVVVRFGENVLNVIERVKEKIKNDIQPGLPQGVKIVTTYDRSDLIHRSINYLRNEIIYLSAIVSVVCTVFLFHLPSAFVVILTLPVAIIIAFICMYYLNVTSNIMSLSGIAIAIGAMVDASIIMVENAHKKLEEWENNPPQSPLSQRGEMGGYRSRIDVIIDAAKEVGPSLFFSLLVITVGFLPVFTLQAQAGRLFKPLAYTKTFAMLFSSFLAITLTPVLMTLFIRGRVRPEEKNPISIILHNVYEPVARFVGIKILGPKIDEIERLGLEMEHHIREIEGTRSVYAERVTTGYFLDFAVKREETARYGLTVEDVQEVIESAIGGMNLTTTVEGRERYPINVRYSRELRSDIEGLKRILVPVMMENAPVLEMSSLPTAIRGLIHVPLGELADIKIVKGPTVIKSEEGLLASYVFIDFSGRDVGGYVEEAKKKIASLKIPEGYYLQWSGEYEFLVKTQETLKLVIPVTILIIFVLIYFNTKSIAKTMIVLLAVPFSLVGSFWLLYLLNYNMSIAVWVGIIALAGLDAETGVIMLLYLELAYEKWKKDGRLKNINDLKDAIMYGAVKRIRPKIMTVSVILAGLVPIMFSHGTGADVMKRIAAPMVGGVITSTILELIIYPVIYMIWRGKNLRS
ncbi:MAG: efflux RND transporter permease subunit [Nitrospirota bacterium]